MAGCQSRMFSCPATSLRGSKVRLSAPSGADLFHPISRRQQSECSTAPPQMAEPLVFLGYIRSWQILSSPRFPAAQAAKPGATYVGHRYGPPFTPELPMSPLVAGRRRCPRARICSASFGAGDCAPAGTHSRSCAHARLGLRDNPPETDGPQAVGAAAADAQLARPDAARDRGPTLELLSQRQSGCVSCAHRCGATMKEKHRV